MPPSARERTVRVRVLVLFRNVRASALCACACMAWINSLAFCASLHLHASFLASFDPCLAYFNPGITSKHIKASYGIKEKLEFIKIRLKKHVFTLKHKYGRDNKTMLIHRLNVTKGYQNVLNSRQNKPSNWGLSLTNAEKVCIDYHLVLKFEV